MIVIKWIDNSLFHQSLHETKLKITASFTLMDSHSHELHNEKYQGHFIIHTFEEVVLNTISFFESFLK